MCWVKSCAGEGARGAWVFQTIFGNIWWPHSARVDLGRAGERIENVSLYVRDLTFAEAPSRLRENVDIVARRRSSSDCLFKVEGCDIIRNAR
jgi:hypothetical protein